MQIARLQSFIIWREWGVVRFVQPIPTRKRQLGKKEKKKRGKKFMVDDDLHSRMMDAQTPPLFQSSSSILATPSLHFCFLSYFPRFIFILFYFILLLFSRFPLFSRRSQWRRHQQRLHSLAFEKRENLLLLRLHVIEHHKSILFLVQPVHFSSSSSSFAQFTFFQFFGCCAVLRFGIAQDSSSLPV